MPRAIKADIALSICSWRNSESSVISSAECRFGLVAHALRNHIERHGFRQKAMAHERESKLREKCKRRHLDGSLEATFGFEPPISDP